MNTEPIRWVDRDLDEYDYIHAFFGAKTGIVLIKDPDHFDSKHIFFKFIEKENDVWYEMEYATNSFYLPDTINVMMKCQNWLKTNCKKDGKFGFDVND